MPVIDPSTEAVLAHVSAGGDADVEHAVQAASRAFAGWKRTTGATRAALLRAIARGVDARRTRLATLQSLNNGKPFAEAEIDVADVIATFDYYASLAERLDTDGETEIALPDADHRAWIRREPAGVAALIVPWNFPMVTTAWKLAPALAAGCTVVLKPSRSRRCPARTRRDRRRSGLPPGVLNVVTAPATPSARDCAHPRVAKLSFTGSTAVGAQVMKTAADTIKGVGLELGGKSSIIVFDDADLDHAVELVTGGGLFNAGQMCSATSRVLVAAARRRPDRATRTALRRNRRRPAVRPGVQMGR